MKTCPNPKCIGHAMIYVGQQATLDGEVDDFWLCLHCGMENAGAEDADEPTERLGPVVEDVEREDAS